MSNENRDYPAWLDEELFAHLTEEEPSAAPQEAPGGSAPKKTGAGKAEAPKKKKKAASPAPAEEKGGARKAKKNADEPKTGKKKPADKGPDGKEPKAPADKSGAGKEDKKKSNKTAAAAPADEKPAKTDEKTAPADEKLAETDGKSAKSRKKKGRKAARSGLVALIVLVSLALILVVATGVFAYLVTNSDTNLPNVYLGGVYVGGMTKEETIAALDAAKWDETRGGTLRVKLPEGVSFELDFLTAGAYQPKEEAAETAIAYGHGDDMFENLLTYIRGVVEPVDLCRTEFTIDRSYVSAAVDKAVDEFEERTSGEPYTVNEKDSVLEVVKGAGDLTLDRTAICDKACELLLTGETEMVWTEIAGTPVMPDFAKIAADLNKEPANAAYDPTKDTFIPEVVGVELDAVKAGELWKQAGVMEKFSVPIRIIEPEITVESLEAVLFHDKLGTCTTSLAGSSANRISNIKVACSRFDGKVLTPGERFIYNEVVGERTEETGFKYAPVYSGTDHTMGIGGGICQVSSTLYNAVQYANLEVNERHCHSMFVGYLDPGLDATVDWGAADFIFTNNSEYPIRLKANVENNRKLTIEVWGTNKDGIRVEIKHGSWPIYNTEWQEKYGVDVIVEYGAWNQRLVYAADGSCTEGEKVYSYYYLPPEDIHFTPPADDDDDEPAPSTPTPTPPPSTPTPTPPPSTPAPTPPPSTPPETGSDTGGNTGGDTGGNTGGDTGGSTGGESGGGDTGGGESGGSEGGGESGGGGDGGEG